MAMLRHALLALALVATPAAAQPSQGATPITPTPAASKWTTTEGDYGVRDFRFRSGETLPELRLHYSTLGSPRRDAAGRITNAVMVLHGTGGSGRQFLSPPFADVLYRAGGVLDIAKYYVILPDGIGHGRSSKPSDGLHARFPKYDYDDMVTAQHTLLTKGLGVEHLRLILGTSMGCMHAFVWGETWPAFADAFAPFACAPTQIAGRNRIWRKAAIEAITRDPDWRGGDYTAEPAGALRTVGDLLLIAGSAPLQMNAAQPTRDAADTFYAAYDKREQASLDANDFLYQVDASRTYDPSARLEAITAPVLWINSADDFINPPALNVERFLPRMKTARFRMIPESLASHGHGSHTFAALWEADLRDLMERTAAPH